MNVRENEKNEFAHKNSRYVDFRSSELVQLTRPAEGVHERTSATIQQQQICSAAVLLKQYYRKLMISSC